MISIRIFCSSNFLRGRKYVRNFGLEDFQKSFPFVVKDGSLTEDENDFDGKESPEGLTYHSSMDTLVSAEAVF